MDMEVVDVAESVTPAFEMDEAKIEVPRYFLRSKRKAVDLEETAFKNARAKKKVKRKEVENENKSSEMKEENMEKCQTEDDDVIGIKENVQFNCTDEKASLEKVSEMKENRLKCAEKKNKFAQSLLEEQHKSKEEKLTLFQRLKRLFGTLKSKENQCN